MFFRMRPFIIIYRQTHRKNDLDCICSMTWNGECKEGKIKKKERNKLRKELTKTEKNKTIKVKEATKKEKRGTNK